ncbi:MAG: hypothetical protein Q4G45_05180 [Actinomycetia bacterium]|nr:hypothetical protein [Actinomycetes bacterium]
MARRPSKHLRPPRPLGAGYARAAEKADGSWVVRSVPGARALKTYTCPGCQNPIGVGVPHIVAWPSQVQWWAQSGVAERRHWHQGCWERRR